MTTARSLLLAILMAACSADPAPAPDPCADGVKNGSETDVDCGGDQCAICSPGQACLAQSDCFDGDAAYIASCWATDGDDVPRCVEGVPVTYPSADSSTLSNRCGGHSYYCSSSGVLWCYSGRWYTNGYCE